MNILKLEAWKFKLFLLLVCVCICLYDPNTKNGNNQSNQNYYRKCRELYVVNVERANP